MSRGRRAVPKVDRPFEPTSASETFFAMMIPPGVLPGDEHIFLEAHLGRIIAERVEKGRNGTGETVSPQKQ